MRERQRERVSHTHTQEPAKGQRLVLPAQDNNGHTHLHTNTHTHVLVILISRIRIDLSVLDLNYIDHMSHAHILHRVLIWNFSYSLFYTIKCHIVPFTNTFHNKVVMCEQKAHR